MERLRRLRGLRASGSAEAASALGWVSAPRQGASPIPKKWQVKG